RHFLVCPHLVGRDIGPLRDLRAVSCDETRESRRKLYQQVANRGVRVACAAGFAARIPEMRLASLLAAILAPCVCAAGGMSPDPTGLWWVPEESGWGLSLVQQQDTVVAVLFVYDDAKRPAWYVATTTGTFFTDPGNQQ